MENIINNETVQFSDGTFLTSQVFQLSQGFKCPAGDELSLGQRLQNPKLLMRNSQPQRKVRTFPCNEPQGDQRFEGGLYRE